jgi:hypothetical protein
MRKVLRGESDVRQDHRQLFLTVPIGAESSEQIDLGAEHLWLVVEHLTLCSLPGRWRH